MIDFSTVNESGNLTLNEQYKNLYCSSESTADNDFIGFTFGDKHSSDFGIVRIITGGELQDSLVPTVQDKTIEIPGGDGTYFLEANYGSKEFNVDIGFDSLTEGQLRSLRQWLNGKDIKRLVFDEMPYKYYNAKMNNTAVLNYVCFDEKGARVYKGNGAITFICYDPFGHCENKFLDDYNSNLKEEWNKGACLLDSNAKDGEANYYDSNKIQNGDSYINIYNPGDVEADFTITFDLSKISSDFEIKLEEKEGNSSYCVKSLAISGLTRKGNDVKLRFSSKTQLLEGLDADDKITGNIYNEYIQKGMFFKLPLVSKEQNETNGREYSCRLFFGPHKDAVVKYDYLYF